MSPGSSRVRLVDSARGVLLSARVIPRASRTSVTSVRNRALLIRVTALPVEGAANRAVLDALAVFLDVPRGWLTIAAGNRGRDKQVQIHGLSVADVQARIEARLPSP